MRVADYIIERLAQENLNTLFMVTGRGVLFLSDAVARQEKIKSVSVHHEQAGAYAAMAYAQCNNSLGACLVSTGCASTNAITPVLCAWQDEIPMIVISGQNTLKETTRHTNLQIRTYGQQEADIVSVVSPITKYAVMIEDPSKIAYELDKALYLAKTGCKGPVWIDVPLDIQNMRVETDQLEHFIAPADEHQNIDVQPIIDSLKTAKRPVVMIGSGIRSSDSINQFKHFVKNCSLPVVYANSAVDVYGAEHALSMGVVSSMAGNRAANFAIQNADYVLVLGNRLTSMVVGNFPDKFARAAQIDVVDIEPKEHEKGTVNISNHYCYDLKDFLESINQHPSIKTDKSWQDKCIHWKQIFPKCPNHRKGKIPFDLYEVTDKISNCLSKDAVVVCDSGLEELIPPSVIAFHDEQRCLHPVCQGAMGYALPASAGAYLSTK